MNIPETSSMELPVNITRFKRGLRVVVIRHGVRFEADVSWNHPDTLRRALEIRERFLAQAGRRGSWGNTGIAGICETPHWTHNHCYPAFSVTCSGRRFRRFTWHTHGGRSGALRAAAHYRSAISGDVITEAQIQEALNHV